MCKTNAVVDIEDERPEVDQASRPVEKTVIMAMQEEMEDAFMRQAVHSSRLADLKCQEQKEPRGNAFPSTDQGTALRSAALRCMMRMLHISAGTQCGWFKAAKLFDIYVAQEGLQIEKLPATCVAIMRITKKVDQKTTSGLVEMQWLPCAQELAGLLSAAGLPTDPLDSAALRQHELAVIGSLGWQLGQCCVEQWYHIFIVRFVMLTNLDLRSVLQQVEAKMLVLARAVIVSQRASDLSQGGLSMGLLCICLIEAGLIPVDLLRPEELTETQWMEVYLNCQSAKVAPQFRLADGDRLVHLLAAATAEPVDGLKRVTHQVAEVITTLQGMAASREGPDRIKTHI
mmetsp:Transcript_52510/g.94176  ORF Transcript_52510/g.94176 Transcript_52510/m.94176 type:complete len:343 (+) Transcript_52510:54-1082(+)|eukprot:CAMPEP_0197661210 /NCGR_PEP_ID=MMETSP1338-20131121/51320_1 /TAXON_ID=43686 ORGANISM="Pelagodinium beii, Strain RCC1491" /NCGR_SAMPLE_ID=MMETSP1338 /ASSEMBLY_ACC=CAM_ASM_000754 /LENGTH=342 /DNA_ID=CAMNT_0043238725 /DNA_START=54 /DNA_END=1082 /DNA_ORIENTATION=-